MSPVSEVEGYCLRWNNHHQTLIQSLYQERSFVDVTLSAEGRSVEVHRLVLSACSTYFKDLLNSHRDIACVIVLKDVPYWQLKALVEFMYKGEVNICEDQLPSLLNTAESLHIKGLTDEYVEMNNVDRKDQLAESLRQITQNISTDCETSSRDSALVTQASPLSMPYLNTTTSSITQPLHQSIFSTSSLLPSQQVKYKGNGESFQPKLDADREAGSSVATSENEDWSDADLGPPTPAHSNTEVPGSQTFLTTTPFPHVSWSESLAAAAAAAVSSAVGSLAAGPSGVQNAYLQAAQASVAAQQQPPPPVIAPVRGKQRKNSNSRRPSRSPSVATLIQDKPYVCPRCGRCYSRRGALIQHQRYECGIEPQFSCPMCPYKIKRKDSLNRHIRNMHHNHQSN